MNEFIKVLRRFVPPYKRYLVLSVIFNILSALLNIFSFATLIPILQILFKVDSGTSVTHAMAWSNIDSLDTLTLTTTPKFISLVGDLLQHC